MTNTFLDKIVFFGQFLRHPVKMGSVCPSSRFLAHSLVELALSDNTADGLIVDLGAGSGAISQELLKSGIAPEHIVAIDISEKFIRIFKRHCPGIELHIDDAKNIRKIIAAHCASLSVKAVISSLPLRNMPDAAIREIMLEVRTILAKNRGVLVQYTYAMCSPAYLEAFGFIKRAERHVICNLPPALVEKYRPASSLSCQ